MKNIAKTFIFATAFVAACASFSTANAGYLGENLQVQPEPASTPAVSPVEDIPVLIIRFNQEHIYFQSPLKKVVSEVKSAKADANYEVRLVLPAASQNVSSQNNDRNLLLVIAELNKLGITSSRISSDMIYSDTVQNQEIRVFVK